MRGRTKLLIAVLVVAVGHALFRDDIRQAWDNFHVKLPEYAPQKGEARKLAQNVSPDRFSSYYHADQGTRTFGIPFEWFVALEQPTIPWLLFNAADPFRDQAYLDRYGFIPDPTNTPIDGIVLPIGFARGAAKKPDPS